MRYRPKKTIKTLELGWIKNKRVRAKDFLGHAVCLGATGSGKSQIIGGEIIPQLLRSGTALLLTTAKATDAGDYERILRRARAPYVIFRPGSAYCFDFIGWVRSLGVSETSMADLLLAGFVDTRSTTSNTSEEIWKDTLKVVVTHMFVILAGLNRIDLKSIEKLLSEVLNNSERTNFMELDPEEILYKALKLDPSVLEPEKRADLDASLRYFTRDFPKLPSKTRQSLRLDFDANLAALQLSPLRDLFAPAEDTQKERISPDLLLEDGISVILDLPSSIDLKTSQTCACLWLRALAIGAQVRRKKKTRHGAVIAWVDEMQRTGASEIIADIIEMSRSSSLGVTWLTQNYSRLTDIWNSPRADALLSGPRIKILASNDAGEQRILAEKLGLKEEDAADLRPPREWWKATDAIVVHRGENYKVTFGYRPIEHLRRGVYGLFLFLLLGSVVPMTAGPRAIHTAIASLMGVVRGPLVILEVETEEKRTRELIVRAHIIQLEGDIEELYNAWSEIADRLPQPSRTYAAENARRVGVRLGREVGHLESKIRKALL